MVFQEPMTALNPVQTIGRQLAEVYRAHLDVPPHEIRRRSIYLLGRIGIPSPEVRLGEYPHQLSGGMRQRVVLAMALACGPNLLIADEPTTALDVTIQAQILALLAQVRRESGMAVLLITHDLGVVAETCEEVIVMYAGRIAEQGPVGRVFAHPRHPYTQGLLASIPRLAGPRKGRLPAIDGMVPSLRELPAGCRFQNRCPAAVPSCGMTAPPLEPVEAGHLVSCFRWRELGRAEPCRKVRGRRLIFFHRSPIPLLQVEGLKVHFPVRGGVLRRAVATSRAVDGVSLAVQPGETLGLVGESGCGKSTLGKAIVRLLRPTEGRIHFEGRDLTGLGRRELKPVRRHLQMIFQDPAEVAPTRAISIGMILEETLPDPRHRRWTASARRRRVGELLAGKVGLPSDSADRYLLRVFRWTATTDRHRPGAGPAPEADHLR